MQTWSLRLGGAQYDANALRAVHATHISFVLYCGGCAKGAANSFPFRFALHNGNETDARDCRQREVQREKGAGRRIGVGLPLSILSVKYFRNICHYICISGHSFRLLLVNCIFFLSPSLSVSVILSYDSTLRHATPRHTTPCHTTPRQFDANEKENGLLNKKEKAGRGVVRRGAVGAGLEQELLGRCWHSAGLFPGGNCLSHISTQPRKFTQVRQAEYNTKIAKKKQTSKDNNEKTKETTKAKRGRG